MKLISIIALILAFSTFAQARPVTVPSTKSYSSAFSYGSSYTHEITTKFTTSEFLSGKMCKDCGTGTMIDAGVSYLRYWQDDKQYGVEGRFQNLSKEFSGVGKSVTLIQLLGVGTFNFSSDLSNAIFTKAGVGLYPMLNEDGDDYENKFGLFIGIGKRFAWMNNVSYSPELRLVKRGDIDFGIQIDILNFSITW